MKVMTVRFVSRARIDVEQGDPLDLGDHGANSLDDGAVAALADVGHALDELLHGSRTPVVARGAWR